MSQRKENGWRHFWDGHTKICAYINNRLAKRKPTNGTSLEADVKSSFFLSFYPEFCSRFLHVFVFFLNPNQNGLSSHNTSASQGAVQSQD